MITKSHPLFWGSIFSLFSLLFFVSSVFAVVNPPAGCPAVSFDSDKNFVVNGEKYFPFGFWAFSGGAASGNWSGYSGSFNAVVDGPTISSEGTLTSNNLKLFAQVDGDAGLAESHDDNEGIIAWEVMHEPNSLGLSGSAVAAQASAMRAADDCGRLIFVTPSLGGIAEGYVNQVRNAVDFAAIETGYLVPQLPIEEVGELFSEGADAMAAVGKPSIFLARVGGYQPARFRDTFRESTVAELRAQIFDAIIRGAKGVFLWPFEKGVILSDLQPFEPANAIYDMEDSSSAGLYGGIKNLASEIAEREEIFTAPVSSGVGVSSNNSDVKCGWRTLSGERRRLICVNLSQDHSPYFDYGSGETVWRLKARAITPGAESFPTDYASGSFIARDLLPGTVAVQDLSTGLTNQNKLMTTVEIDFDTVPTGATFTYAVYADNSRDQAPDTRIFLSNELAINGSGPQTFPVVGVTLEHTKNYYLLIQTNTAGVRVRARDVRGGVRPKDDSTAVPLAESFEDLHVGDSASNVRLTLSGDEFSAYCVEKNFGNCANGSVAGGVLTDSFSEYAVHIYHFEPAEEELLDTTDTTDPTVPDEQSDILPPNLPPDEPPPLLPPPTVPTTPLSSTPCAPSTGTVLPAVVGPLSLGMKNNAQVSALQRLLATDRTLYPEGIVSGYYGPLTREAVKRFQLRYSLVNLATTDPSLIGFAGPATRAKMNEVLRQTSSVCSLVNLPEQTRLQLIQLLHLLAIMLNSR